MIPSACSVALPIPSPRPYSYAIPAALADRVMPGARVVVPVRRREMVGVVLSVGDPPERSLKPVLLAPDARAIVPGALLELARWMAGYYASPIGIVLRTMLPAALWGTSRLVATLLAPERAAGGVSRDVAGLLERGGGRMSAGALARKLRRPVWDVLQRLERAGAVFLETEPPDLGPAARTERYVALEKSLPTLLEREAEFGRARRQREAYEALEALDGEATVRHLVERLGFSRAVLSGLVARGLAHIDERERPRDPFADVEGVPPADPTPAQRAAISAVQALERGDALTLFGVTGSGKTLVYLEALRPLVEAGRGAIVLVPEIALTPQLVARFRERLEAPVVELHSGLSDGDRLRAWTAARAGTASVIIGTRSAVFAPLARPGLIVVDEEHDTSYKQQEGFRYSGRDLAVWRARALDVPVVLGSATPSLESIENARAGRYERLVLPDRTGSAGDPAVQLVDMRRHPPTDGLTQPLSAAIQAHLDAGGQALIYLNRRGFAPVLLCPACGQVAECLRCDARMVVHQRRAQLVCHHCGAERPLPSACPECQGELQAVGHGTERLEQALRERFGEAIVARVDRDAVRRRGELARQLDRVRRGDARVLVGTQMVTKGHDFPRVTLVGVVDTDQGLFGTDFRSSERLAQSLIQVAGRAGRAEHPGQVLIQTLFPEHPLLRVLLTSGYAGFAELALAERQQAGWPPFSYLALLRAEASGRPAAFAFLEQARDCAPEAGGRVQLLGPAPAPMERRSGRYRGQLLVRAETRASLQRFLSAWQPALEAATGSRRARWSLDVDPVELF